MVGGWVKKRPILALRNYAMAPNRSTKTPNCKSHIVVLSCVCYIVSVMLLYLWLKKFIKSMNWSCLTLSYTTISTFGSTFRNNRLPWNHFLIEIMELTMRLWLGQNSKLMKFLVLTHESLDARHISHKFLWQIHWNSLPVVIVVFTYFMSLIFCSWFVNTNLSVWFYATL